MRIRSTAVLLASMLLPLSAVAAPTVLFIGDSHSVQSFGRNLDALLRTLPQARVASFASWGTSPASWFAHTENRNPYFEHGPDGRLVDVQSAPTPVFGELLAQYHPTLTIIELGSNLFGVPFDYSAATIHQMAAMTAAAHSECLWIGPPDSRSRTGPQMDELYGILRGASAPYCHFVDSRKLTHYPATGGDDIHYDYLGPDGMKQTRTWARKVFELILAL